MTASGRLWRYGCVIWLAGMLVSGCSPSPLEVTATQLVQLRETETFGMLDDHDRRVGNINPHFDHSGRNQDLYLVGLKLSHDSSFFVWSHLAVK